MPCSRTRKKTGERLISVAVATVLVIALVSPWLCYVTGAQSDIPFTKVDKFSIPEVGGVSTISFNASGSYTQASFENGAWKFVGLTVGNFPQQRKLNLTVSAQNSNVTITSYRATNATDTSMGSVRLSYLVEGNGTQTFNFGVNPNGGYWSVIVQRVYLPQYGSWDILSDGTVTVTEAMSGVVVTIMCYTYSTSFVDALSQPFYAQHSVILATGIGMLAVVVLCLAIWRVNLKAPQQSKVPRHNRPLTIKHVSMELTERE